MERVLGVVAVDLYAADLNFVFGEADPREEVAVISIVRLEPERDGVPPDETLLHLRLLKEGTLDWGTPTAYQKLFVEQAEKLTGITKLQVSK